MLKTATIVKQATKEKPYLILADRRKMYSKQEWLNLRQNYIGGSDAAAVMSCNPWRTPFQVFAEKKGLVKRQPAGEAAYFGNLFEGLLVEEFCKRTGYKSVSVPFVFQSAQSPWLIADLDSVVDLGNGKFGVLEIKTTNTFSGADEWNNGEVGNLPLPYYIQCQEYLYVTGLDTAFIACLIGGQKFIYQEIQRDEETINAIVQMTGAWYQNYFLKNVPPPVEHTDSAYLGQLYPKSEEKAIELPTTARQILEDYENACKDSALAKETKEKAEAKLKLLLADAEVGIIESYKITWKNVSTTRLDSKKVKAILTEEQLKECSTTTTTRKFTVGAAKK